VAAPAGAAALSGHTAQGLPVALGAAHRGHRDFRYQARMACSDGSTFTDDAFTDSVRVVRGRFARRVTSDRGAVHTMVSGLIAGRPTEPHQQLRPGYEDELAVGG